MYRYYPEQIKMIMNYIEALNSAEARNEALNGAVGSSVWPREIELMTEENVSMGKLVDEIGGSWSWIPPVHDKKPDPHSMETQEFRAVHP